MKKESHFLASLALKRPISAVMILLAILTIGYIAYTRIPAKMMPDGFNLPYLYVFHPYRNASPREVEEQITKPVEEILGTVRNIKRMRARSMQRGSGIFIEFESGTDMALAYGEVVDRLDRVRPELPSDQQFRYIHRWSPSQEPVMMIAVGMKEGYDIDDPFELLEKNVQRKFETIDGVAKVELWGAREKSIYINLRDDRIQSYNVNLYQLWQTLEGTNFILSGGDLIEGNKRLIVSSIAKFQSLEEIENLVIEGTNVRVKDVADVRFEFEEERRINRVNLMPGIAIGIFHEDQANPIELNDKLKEAMRQAFEDNPEMQGFEYYLIFTQGDVMKDTIQEFKMTALYGGIFAFLVLFFFLRKLKMTLIISLALPMSLLMMLIVIYFMGWSLNMLTMMGLILSVGMVVDNSIVVAENIFRLRQSGLDRRESALKGTGEVGLAITMSTLTTIVVFLPIFLMSGDQVFSFFMSRLGLPIVFAILASLFIALYFIPLGTARFHEPEKTEKLRLAKWFNALYHVTIEKLNIIYTKHLRVVLNNRVAFVVFLVFLFSTLGIIVPKISQTDNLEGNINDFRIIINAPENFTLRDTDRIFTRLEKIVDDNHDKYGVKVQYSRFGSHRGQLRVFLNDPPKKFLMGKLWDKIRGIFVDLNEPMTRDEVIEDLKKKIPTFPGVDVQWGWNDNSGNDTSITVSVFGKDLDQIEQYVDEIKRRVSGIDGVLSAETDYEEEGVDEIQLRIDRRKAQSMGINARRIASTVAYSLRGNMLTRFQLMDREIEVYLQLQKEDRETLEQLKNLSVVNDSGQRIPLSAVVQPIVERGPTELIRENRRTMLSVKVNTTRDDMNNLYGAISEEMGKMDLKRGYSWSFGDRFRRMQDTESGMTQVVPLVITFVFFLMGVLFESFILPLSVLAAIPFAFWGAFWLLFLTNTTMDPMAYIGLIILIGVVVNNAIVLIDLINRLRKEGMERMEAIIEAGRLRFRPILMTALTTVFGLLPMTIGIGSTAGISYTPLGRAFTGGLLASTISTLFVVPLFYTYLDDLRNKVGLGIMRSIFSHSKSQNIPTA
ncbi:MAG: efflux RND transporter permease subunit [Acidobacteria bacterium]|nr:efflux RND transporter permease subunit [Acidobacteriota bacterium]